MLNILKGPFGALFFAIPLRFIPMESYISHFGSVYTLITGHADWRLFNGILSVIHLVEIAFFTRNRILIWGLALNPLSIFLVSQPGDLFWLCEGCILSGVLLFERHLWKGIAVLFFTLALVFL